MKVINKETGKTYKLIKRKVKLNSSYGYHIVLFNFKTETFKQFLFRGNKKELFEFLNENFKIRKE